MMRKAVFIFLSLIGVFTQALAQKADTLQNNFIESIYALIHAKGKPLVVVNGIIYKATSKPFETKDISAIEVLQPPGSVTIYGPSAADGAMLITTKQNMVDAADQTIIPVSANKSARQSNVDSANSVEITKFSQLANDSALFVLDGLPSDKNLNGISPDEILNINILKWEKASELFEGQAKHGIVVVVTKKSAIMVYQQKLSSLSSDYKEYLQLHHNDDNLIYIVNGVKYSSSSKERIGKLYELFTREAKFQNFSLHFIHGVNNIPNSVEINAEKLER